MKMKTKKLLLLLSLFALVLLSLVFLIGGCGNGALESSVYEIKRGQISEYTQVGESWVDYERKFIPKYGTRYYDIIKISSRPGKVKGIWEVIMKYDKGPHVYGKRYYEKVEEWSFREKTPHWVRDVSDEPEPDGLWYRIIHKIW